MVTNRGHVPVYNVSFKCGANFQGVFGKLVFSGATISPVAELDASRAVTRACVVESADPPPNATQTVTVDFVWPVIGYKDSTTAYFSIRRGSPGFFMVPDLPR